MAESLYAWTEIRYGADENGRPKSVAYGETVTKAKLNISDEEFRALMEAGSVRSTKPPELPETWGGSPIEYLREQAAQAELASNLSSSYFGPPEEELLRAQMEGNVETAPKNDDQ